jgi:hypothetical protein
MSHPFSECGVSHGDLAELRARIARADARGRITSHRARSTIASQLYDAKESMTLFELKASLGHRSPQSTQHYTADHPDALGPGLRRYRLLRAEPPDGGVLIDREAVQNGAAAAGTPWQSLLEIELQYVLHLGRGVARAAAACHTGRGSHCVNERASAAACADPSPGCRRPEATSACQPAPAR